MIQNTCSVMLLGLVAIAVLVAGLWFIANLPDIERSRADRAWAVAAAQQARAELAAERRASMGTISLALLAIFGLSTVTVWMVAGLLFLKDTRAQTAPTIYILADSKRQAFSQVEQLNLPIGGTRDMVVIDGDYKKA